MPYADSDYERSWKMQTKGVMLSPVKPECPTPGPWYCHVQTAVAEESDGEYGDATCITTADADSYSSTGNRGDVIAWVPHDRKHGPNARLIAAAPDLLNVARLAFEYVLDTSDRFGKQFNAADEEAFNNLMDAANAAIDKAEAGRC